MPPKKVEVPAHFWQAAKIKQDGDNIGDRSQSEIEVKSPETAAIDVPADFWTAAAKKEALGDQLAPDTETTPDAEKAENKPLVMLVHPWSLWGKRPKFGGAANSDEEEPEASAYGGCKPSKQSDADSEEAVMPPATVPVFAGGNLGPVPGHAHLLAKTLNAKILASSDVEDRRKVAEALPTRRGRQRRAGGGLAAAAAMMALSGGTHAPPKLQPTDDSNDLV